jgi:hypothetical protein
MLDRWLATSALRSLVESEGGLWPQRSSRIDLLRELESFSARWDYRNGGRERLEITDDHPMTPELAQCIAALGLVEMPPPSLNRYDRAFVPGGTAVSSFLRVRFVRSLLDDGIELPVVTCLGSDRELPDREIELLADIESIARAPRTEAEALELAARRYLARGPTSYSRVASTASTVWHLTSDQALPAVRVRPCPLVYQRDLCPLSVLRLSRSGSRQRRGAVPP